jgi:hypothetical protein
VAGIKKKIFVGAALLFVLGAGAVGAAGYYLTRPLDVAFTQDPNTVEAQEADRKLRLLTEAQSERKQGFVRFSEVEINSFLEGKYQVGSPSAGESPVELLKAGVLLDDGQITFVTWHRMPLMGFEVPLVWQRVITPQSTTNGWNFAVRSMRVGAVQVPAEHWERVEKLLGATDTIFEERKAWLKSLPMVTLAKNEQSESPEVRLYTYLPEENIKANETVTE